MDLYDFYNTFIMAVAGDGDLDAWAKSRFGVMMSVFADLSSHALPTVDGMPYVIMHTPEAAKHQNRRVNEYGLAVDVAINRDALQLTAYENVELPAGIELILDGVTLIVAAIKGALPANTAFGYSLSADTLGSLPEIYAYLDFTFSETVTIGTDPLT